MALNLIADRVVCGKLYPAMAKHQAEPYTMSWREFGRYWPYTEPLRLQEYLNYHSIDYHCWTINQDFPSNSWYVVSLGFFNFDIDYFAMLPDAVLHRIHMGTCSVLFYYHEGDNPFRIKLRLDQLCTDHGVSINCYKFISGNTAAEQLPNFIWFPDFEFWYYQRNIGHAPTPVTVESRPFDFTCLNRLHKWWRATVVADLQQHRMLENSVWSYCEAAYGADDDCPIEIDSIPGLRKARQQFLQHAPYFCDDLDNDQRNNHSLITADHFTQSYCNIVIESQFDVDQSHAAFLSEKTFKPIKHAQLFFVAGGQHSLSALRKLGYSTFDDILDTSYDEIENSTQRWIALRNSIMQAQPNLYNLYKQAINDIKHNQQLFVSNKQHRLNTLIEKINEPC